MALRASGLCKSQPQRSDSAPDFVIGLMGNQEAGIYCIICETCENDIFKQHCVLVFKTPQVFFMSKNVWVEFPFPIAAEALDGMAGIGWF